ncbi:hypothetical protein HME9302_00855 [Alteripontixanthobacter maritimus]|uniref:PD-(D/E)XK endonuclease-like domain-containing protein n=1 Tax=Alteripontixanthobacter maritimus TaxID=2161824 RepID=A0A369Q4K9_9SPHN|nr:PD-(D/E)XK nuclease family protein [Alteripontixanthobacter maritimus]RDC59664.1 hypothetical protein HME9302_00855 [Alteripontixanthobacter maritimus]
MTGRLAPQVYSIAAHRGFADALVAGLVPRYSDGALGLARLTLLLPSSRMQRTVTEAFIRHYDARSGTGADTAQGLLLPRMAVIGDLDLDETLGSLLDPLGAADIPPAVDPTFRWLAIADILKDELADKAPSGATLLRLARDVAATMDRLLAEDVAPEDLTSDRILDLLGDLAGHWQNSLRTFARVQQHWLTELQAMNRLDASARRNRLFDHAAQRWKADQPKTPIVAAGVTSAAPALAALLRVVADMPQGAVIMPDLDLAMDDGVWDELGRAGVGDNPGDPPFAREDAVTHPQYHLKLLLNRMGVARAEVRQWHRKGDTAAPPERTHAISSLFLPPEASKGWVDLPADKRRLAGVSLIETANPEEEAQAVALLVRQAVEHSERRVAIVTPDRGLARRIVQHLRRWHIQADDSAGQSLDQTRSGRLFLLLAETLAEHAAPVPLAALLEHPLVAIDQDRGQWLSNARAFERALRGPRIAPGLEPLDAVAQNAQVAEWWSDVAGMLAPLFERDTADTDEAPLADWLDLLATTAEALCGEALWAREDGRELSRFVEALRLNARERGTTLAASELHLALRDAMEGVAVRPSYGGHPRVAIYGLLESRGARADLVICAGLNEGSWPARPATDPLLAPPVLRALGVPGADFRIGLSAHDLAGAMGAPEVVLSRARRDSAGPAIASRFLLRVRALLGADLLSRHVDTETPELARALDYAPRADPYPQPAPMPTAEQRPHRISVTAIDRLRSDPYQFYAAQILRLSEMDALDAEPSPGWQGQVVHDILQKWHEGEGPIDEVAKRELKRMNAHPLMRALWQPRLMKALQWVDDTICNDDSRVPALFERWGDFKMAEVEIFGRIDRLDRLAEGGFAVVDYKTGRPPTGAQVEAGYALQLGTLGLMVEAGGFAKDDPTARGEASVFEYWSLAKSAGSDNAFGFIATPIMTGNKRSGIPPEDFLPETRRMLGEALDKYITGNAPFIARENPDAPSYATYDQLMRLDEWMGRI